MPHCTGGIYTHLGNILCLPITLSAAQSITDNAHRQVDGTGCRIVPSKLQGAAFKSVVHEALLHVKSAKGIAWDSRRPEFLPYTAGLRGPSATGARTTALHSRGVSGRGSAPVDEEVALLLDTLEQLSGTQQELCARVERLAASTSKVEKTLGSN